MLVQEFEGKTEEEARKLALETLNLGEDQVKVELVEQGKVGFFGFRKAKQVKIKVYYEEQRYSNMAIEVKRYVEGLFERMKFTTTVELTEEDKEKLYIDISSKESGLIIGKQGSNLEAIQFLVNMVFNKDKRDKEKWKKIVLDVEGYCSRREANIKSLAMKTAQYVKESKQSRSLPAMSPFERRLIHLALQDVKGIGTKSEGQGTFKNVKIFLK